VCFQEPWNSRGGNKIGADNANEDEEDAVQATFKSDFAFMKVLGYETELCSKGKIRTATFWKVEGLSSQAKLLQGLCPSKLKAQPDL
jgi:hypothetical protein